MSGAAGFLGTNYENDVPVVHDVETGEIKPSYDPLIKWAMQAAAREALKGDSTHRIHFCMRHRRPNHDEVGVRRSEASGKTYFDGVMTCGSVWTCPVCATKIQAVRAPEVERAIAVHLSRGGSVAMATLTFRHDRWDQLKLSLRGFKRALGRFRSGRAWQNVKSFYGVVGSVTALEVTYGNSGWHPHAHILFFLDSPTDLSQLQKDLLPLWAHCVESSGVSWVGSSGLALQDASNVRGYLTKYSWGPQDELVRSHTKRGRGSGLTPFDMLRRYSDDPSNNGHLLLLFKEFADAFFGTRQLSWSRGLRQSLLGSAGVTDAQIADSVGEKDPLLASIKFSDWQVIRRYALQGHVLLVAKDFGVDGIDYLLEPYRRRYNAFPDT